MAGRLKSSRNAFRHGLSIPKAADALADPQPHRFVELLMPEVASQFQQLAVLEMAQAQIQLQQVAIVRKGLLEKLDLQCPSLDQLRRLAALERYECRAHRQRRRAKNGLRGTEAADDDVQ